MPQQHGQQTELDEVPAPDSCLFEPVLDLRDENVPVSVALGNIVFRCDLYVIIDGIGYAPGDAINIAGDLRCERPPGVGEILRVQPAGGKARFFEADEHDGWFELIPTASPIIEPAKPWSESLCEAMGWFMVCCILAPFVLHAAYALWLLFSGRLISISS